MTSAQTKIVARDFATFGGSKVEETPMKNIYFTVGPSQLFPTVEKHMQEAMQKQIGSISHRGKQFEDIFTGIVTSLKKLWNIPDEYTVFFVGSGTEAMERTIENVVRKESFHFVNGSFSKRFFDTAHELGKQPKKIEVEPGKGFSFAKVKIPKTAEVICFTHNETSTGVMLPVDEIAACKKLYPEKLIAIDTVSSAPYPDIDFLLTDIVFFSVQKAFGLPAGLGVMIASPQAIEKAKSLAHHYSLSPLRERAGVRGTIGSYHTFLTLQKYALQNQTPETPPVLEMYLFQRILQDFLTMGIENLRKQTNEKASLLYDFFDNHPVWNAAVTDKTFRSSTVIVAQIGEKQKELREYMKTKGMIVGSGYGAQKDAQIRIANFPALSKGHIETLLACLDKFGR